MERVLPILFNTEMVKAIMDDRKKATRRIIKPQPKTKLAYYFAGSWLGTWGYPSRDAWKYWNDKRFRWPDKMTEEELFQRWKPPCKTGDILYVRETWAHVSCINCNMGQSYHIKCQENPNEYDDGNSIEEGCFIYKAGYLEPQRICWRPSIHMPKEAARIWLRVNSVSVERMHDMILDDFLSEGISLIPEAFNDPENAYQQAKKEFMNIWDSVVKKSDREMYGWDMNPWVWVIKFERCEKLGDK